MDWPHFLSKKNEELKRLNGVYMKLLSNAGVEFIEGRGKLIDEHTVEVDGKRYTVRNRKGEGAVIPLAPPTCK